MQSGMKVSSIAKGVELKCVTSWDMYRKLHLFVILLKMCKVCVFVSADEQFSFG
jgi:hypothetical protein